jgi:hypothetical protein
VLKNFIQPDHPFYRPLWRRYVLVGSAGIWAFVEVFYTRDGFWGVLTAGLFAYLIWIFLYTYQDEKTPPEA